MAEAAHVRSPDHPGVADGSPIIEVELELVLAAVAVLGKGLGKGRRAPKGASPHSFFRAQSISPAASSSSRAASLLRAARDNAVSVG